MAVAFANHGAPSGGLASGGCSAIGSPAGSVSRRPGRARRSVGMAVEDHAGGRAGIARLAAARGGERYPISATSQ
jgi:hypothetical protein